MPTSTAAGCLINMLRALVVQHATDDKLSEVEQCTTGDSDVTRPELAESTTKGLDPASTALGLPEILEKILLYLSYRHLARTLRVSKHWQQVIMGSIELRRKLWLEPVITQKPLPYNKLIIEPHPIFLAAVRDFSNSWGYIKLETLNMLKSVPAQTLVTQPPFTASYVHCGTKHDSIECPKGIIFGELLNVCEKQQGQVRFVDNQPYSTHKAVYDSIYHIDFFGNIAANTGDVTIAEEA